MSGTYNKSGDGYSLSHNLLGQGEGSQLVKGAVGQADL